MMRELPSSLHQRLVPPLLLVLLLVSVSCPLAHDTAMIEEHLVPRNGAQVLLPLILENGQQFICWLGGLLQGEE